MTAITVAVRLRERETIVRQRDLSRLAVILLHPAFVEGAGDYIRAYATEESSYKGHGFCAPQDAGLVAIDLPSRKILAYEGYATSVGRCDAHRITKARDGIGPHSSRWETRAVWTTLMAEGRVKLKVSWEKPSGLPEDFTEALRLVGPYIMGMGPHPEGLEKPAPFEDLPYSLETLHELDAAAARIKALEGMRWRDGGLGSDGLVPEVGDVLVDLSPWTVQAFPFTRKGAEALRAGMEALGFPGCGPDAAGWASWPGELRGKPHSGAELERMRRQERKAQLIQAPA